MAVRSTIRSEPREVSSASTRATSAGSRDVVAHDEGAFGGGSAYEVFDLEGEEASLGSQFFEVFGDFGGDAADHFHALHDGGDVAHCGAVAHFEDREGLEDFVESLL